MSSKAGREAERQESLSPARMRRAHLLALGVLQLILAAELIVLATRGHWMHVLLVGGVMAVCLTPLLLRDQLPDYVPLEVQIAVILFIFATLFLGEVREYYERFWWWDVALHGTAGLLLGLFGFMVVYILNENRVVEVQMEPAFLAIFAFFFAVGIGALWEIFEFAMDQIFGLTMQKPKLGDPSGLTDTMLDMIVNAIGAAIVSLGGWLSLRRGRPAPLGAWLQRLVARHPRLFGE